MFDLTKTVSAVVVAGMVSFGAVSAANAIALPVDDRQWDNAVDPDPANGGAVVANGDDLTINGNVGVLQFFPPNTFGPIAIDVTSGTGGTQTIGGVNNVPAVDYDNAFLMQTGANFITAKFAVTSAQNSGIDAGFGIANLSISIFDVTGLAALIPGGISLDPAMNNPDVGPDQGPDSTATTTADFIAANGGSAINSAVTLALTDAAGVRISGSTEPDPFFVNGLNANSEYLVTISGTAFDLSPTSDPSYNFTISSVPLPAPVVLLISALIGLGFLGRRKVRV